MHWTVRGIVCGVLAVLAAGPGCTGRETSPLLSASLTTVSVPKRPTHLVRGLLPDTLLVACYAEPSVCLVGIGEQGLTVERRLEVKPGPLRLVPDREGQRVYVLHAGENAISILGRRPLEIQRTLRTGHMTLAGGALRPSTNELWLCDGQSAVNVLVVPAMQLKARLPLGRFPQEVAFSRDGHRAYITLKGENAVAVVDAGAKQEVARLTVGIYPYDIVRVGGTLCVSNSGSHDVSLLDSTQLIERARLPVRRTPRGLTVQGTTVWVACEDSYRLLAIDAAQARVIGSVKASFYPGSLQALPDGRLAVADPRRGRVVLITPAPPAPALP